MNKLIVPSILVATILVAGISALMPIEKASTKGGGEVSTQTHTATIAAVDKFRGTHSIVLPLDTTIEASNDKFVIMDLHKQVDTDGGFVIVQIAGAPITVANLKLVAIDATGAIQGSAASFTDLTGAALGAPAPFTQTLHAHIPSAATTVLIALDAVNANVVLPSGTIITTTIDVMR